MKNVFVLLGLVILSAGCGRFVYMDGPYRGRVFNPASGQPIEGAAVLAVWWTESGLLVPHPIESVKTPQVTIFKPGYRVHRGPLLTEEDPQPFPLRLLETKEERLENLGRLFFPSDVPQVTYPNLLRLVDIERVNLGLKPMKTEGQLP